MCGSYGFSSDVCMRNVVHGAGLVSLLVNNLSGHFYSFSFYSCSFNALSCLQLSFIDDKLVLQLTAVIYVHMQCVSCY